MFENNITSANAELVLTCDTLYPSGVSLQNFATDQSYASESIQLAETRMGVDGHMAAGYTPVIKTVQIQLEASSPSREVFENIAAASETNKTAYETTLVARIPSIGRIFTWSIGVLHDTMPAPAAKKVLDPTTYVLHFEKFEVSNI